MNLKKKYKTLNFLRLQKYINDNPNKNLKEIGGHFGVSRRTISLEIQKHNLKYNNKRLGMKNLNIHNEIKLYIESNPDSSMSEIASFLGVTRQAISLSVKKYNINYKRSKKRLKIDIEKLKEYIESNLTLNSKDIGRVFNTSSTYINFLIRKHNIEYKILKKLAK